jgi:ATP-dependent RNA helicase DBP3
MAAAAAAVSGSSSTKEALEITVEGRNADFKPFLSFSEAGFPKPLLKCTEGFDRPTQIQSYTWPIAMAKRDLIGIAETGSGKTLAFALPGLTRIFADLKTKNTRSMSEPGILAMAPTRELAIQIAEVFGAAGSPSGARGVCLFGGMPKDMQRAALRDGVHIVVATPGRLMDLIEEKCLSLAKVKYLVLDEADRMLDLGFEPAIRALIGMTPPDRQTLMFSATWPQAIQVG